MGKTGELYRSGFNILPEQYLGLMELPLSVKLSELGTRLEGGSPYLIAVYALVRFQGERN
ncbi:MAG TPA: hypothetical protein V6C65_28565 [Allocoleopsis sp.]